MQVLGEIQQLNNVLNGYSAPDPIDIGSLQDRLLNLTQQIDFFLTLIGNQRVNVKAGAAQISRSTWNPLVSAAFTVGYSDTPCCIVKFLLGPNLKKHVEPPGQCSIHNLLQ